VADDRTLLERTAQRWWLRGPVFGKPLSFPVCPAWWQLLVGWLLTLL